jgi:predicted ATPase/DNA-binding winged helix-turn-helix (wHTH) protein
MRNAPVLASVPLVRRFGRFELRPQERSLLSDGIPVALGARAFDLLVAFAERPGTLITKDELLATVWPGVVVEENNLQVQVSTLRKVLGPGALATIPGRGYRFNLPTTFEGAEARSSVAENRSASAALSEAPPEQPRTNLPSRLPMLYGRGDDLAAIVALLRRRPVVTITGSGGIGKTRVAQAVAQQLLTESSERFPDGFWWVELSALADGALVPSAIAQAMNLSFATEHHPTPEALASALASHRALLVLDNCEHLAESVAVLLDALTTVAPHLSVLVTSQETLRASDEHVYRLGGLAVSDASDVETASHSGAVELFAARAQAADPRFVLTAANLPAVIEICRRLDGIPLAIELAAARMPLLGVEGLRTRLHERFNVLTGGARVVLRRHQTLRATLEWSHALLTPDEQTVFRRLGVFAGGFTLEAAQHVASDDRIDPWTTLDHLGALVEKSLILAEGDPIPRYRMLETTRAYALERLAQAGEMQGSLPRHAQALVALLEPLERHEWLWRGTSEPAARAELDNLRAALEWANSAGDGPLAVTLAGLSYSVWWSTAHLAEGLARCLALRRHLDSGVSTSAAARFWLTIAELGLYSSRREGYDAAVRAAALYRELGDDQRRFESLTHAAVQATRFGTVADMKAQIDEAAQLEQPEWPARQRGKLQFARAFWFARQGRFEEALTCARRQVALCREGGVEIGALYGTSNVTFMEVLSGRPLEASNHAREAIARLHEIGADAGAGHLYFARAVASIVLDRIDDALTAVREAYPRLLSEGDHYRVLLPLALIAALRGRLGDALRLSAFDDTVQARSGENASIFAPLLRSRLDPLLAVLTGEERTRLAREGGSLEEAQAFRLALGDTT